MSGLEGLTVLLPGDGGRFGKYLKVTASTDVHVQVYIKYTLLPLQCDNSSAVYLVLVRRVESCQEV